MFSASSSSEKLLKIAKNWVNALEKCKIIAGRGCKPRPQPAEMYHLVLVSVTIGPGDEDQLPDEVRTMVDSILRRLALSSSCLSCHCVAPHRWVTGGRGIFLNTNVLWQIRASSVVMFSTVLRMFSKGFWVIATNTFLPPITDKILHFSQYLSCAVQKFRKAYS